MRLLLALAILVLTAGAARAACPAGSLDSAGAAVKDARADLVRIPLSEGQTDIPPPVGFRIELLKNRLRAFTDAAMACAPEALDARALQDEMSAKGDAVAAGLLPGHGYGRSLTYEIRPIAAHPDLVGVTATLGIECGVDTLLTLYQRQEGGGWRPILARRSQPMYKTIGGAWASVRYAVSPSDAMGRWFLATTSTPAACAPGWRGIHSEVTRPGANANRPTLLYGEFDRAYLGTVDNGQMTIDASGFEVRHEVASLDGNVVARTSVHRYAVAGNTVTRIPPVALNPRDFVDEWLGSGWPMIEAWSAADLRPIHAQLVTLNLRNTPAEKRFGPMRACKVGAVQVELALGQSGQWFFEVAAGPAFRMLTVSQQPSSACRGRVIAIDNP